MGWHDPELWKELDIIREMVKRTHQTPLHEWPLAFVEEFDALLVIREWPDGSVTAYMMSKNSGTSGE